MGSALGDELEYYASHPMLLLYIHLASFVLFCLSGVANRRIPWTDHSRLYFCFNYAFFHIYTFAAMMPILNRVLPFRIRTLAFLGEELSKFIYPLVAIHFMLSTIGFLVVNWWVAFKRTQIEKPWVIFLSICLGSVTLFAAIELSGAISWTVYKNFFDFNNRFLLGFLAGTIIVMLFGICFCPKSRPCSPTDPWISNAKWRLAWSLIYVPLPTIPILFTVLHSFKPMETVNTVEEVRIYGFLEQIPRNFHALFFAIAGIFLLPAYRTALFTRKGWNRGKKNGIVVTKLPNKVSPTDYSTQVASYSVETISKGTEHVSYPTTSQPPTLNAIDYPVSSSQTIEPHMTELREANLPDQCSLPNGTGQTVIAATNQSVPEQSHASALFNGSYQGTVSVPVIQSTVDQQVLSAAPAPLTNSFMLPGQMTGFVSYNQYSPSDYYFIQQSLQSRWDTQQAVLYQQANQFPEDASGFRVTSYPTTSQPAISQAVIDSPVSSSQPTVPQHDMTGNGQSNVPPGQSEMISGQHL